MTARPDDVEAARSRVIFGAALVALGIGIAGTASPTFGGVVVIAGWLLLVWSIHRFGRARAARVG
jgi:uncharacterized membrane protein YgdD (TMEM256/DUF423 family)